MSGRPALLIIDVLNTFDFTDAEPLLAATRAIVEPINALRRQARDQGAPVIYVNDNYGRWRNERSDLIAYLSRDEAKGAAIARALAADPEVLVLDEPVSALDPSVRERVLRFLGRLQQERQLTMILVSHDLDVVGAVADEVLVMQEGRIVEQGATVDVFASPQHPFTRELVDASGPAGR